MYIDAHCHLADPRLDADRDALLARAAERGITGFIQGGVGPEDWGRQRELARRYPGRWHLVFGLHPWWIAAHSGEECLRALDRLEREAAEARGVGELGLDRGQRCPEESWARQEDCFVRQLGLARALRKPLVLHIVKAHEPALAILRREGVPAAGGIVHSYSGSAAQAAEYRKLGLTLSVGGPLARKAFEKLRRAVVSIPWTEWVLETDSPDQPPPSHEGGLNEPATLWEVAEEVGRIHGVAAEQVMENSTRRLKEIFSL